MPSHASIKKNIRWEINKILGNAPDTELSSTAYKILDRYIADEGFLRQLTDTLKRIMTLHLSGITFGTGPAEWALVSPYLKPSEVREYMLLIAAGAQIATAQLRDIPLHDIKISLKDVSHNEQSDIGYHMLDDDILIRPIAFHKYIGCKYVHRCADPAVRDLWLPEQSNLIHDILLQGAEEYYHHFQFKHTQKLNELIHKIMQTYGGEHFVDSFSERSHRLFEAQSQGREAWQAFYAQDPIEKDAHEFLERIEPQLSAAAERFAKMQGRGY